MRVEIEYGGYNARRYSKPWGALVTANGTKLEYDFSKGNYLGDDHGGKVYIDCNAGDVVASGQKDGRGSGTVNDLYIVQEDGTLQETDRVSALEHLESRKEVASPLAKFSDDELIAEIKRRGLSI